MRTILGQTLSIKNYLAFGLFGLIVGIFSILLLYFKLKIAYRIFMVALVLGFAEYFRSILMDLNGFGDLVGILSLYIITSFGLGIAVFVQFIVIFVRKNKE